LTGCNEDNIMQGHKSEMDVATIEIVEEVTIIELKINYLGVISDCTMRHLYENQRTHCTTKYLCKFRF